MAIQQLSVEVGICDACGKRRHAGPKGEPPEGSSGTVTVQSGDEPVAVDWFSCSSAPGHIGRAVRVAAVRYAASAPPDADGAR